MLSRPEAGKPNSLWWIRADFPEEPPFKNNTNKMTYLVNLKTETAKGQRRAKNTSPLPNIHFSLVFLFPALSGSPSSPLSTGQHQESQTHLPALYYHGTWVIISPGLSPGTVPPAGVHSGVHSVPNHCWSPFLCPLSHMAQAPRS